MERYGAYKDSGVEWIGEIPLDWEVCRVRSLYTLRKETVDDGNPNELLSVSEYYGVDYRRNRIGDSDVLARAESLEGYQRCYPGDLVMNIMLAWKGAQGTSRFEGLVSPSYGVFSPSDGIEPRYYHYLFRTDQYRGYFKSNSSGIIDSRLRLYPEVFLHLSAHTPALNEQGKIAEYLDVKTAEIDALVADCEREIELLQEYRKVVISEAVTKGLNPDAPMKDSGIEWIGEIPATWKACKLRYCGMTQNGISKGGEFFGTGRPFVSYGNVYRNELDKPELFGLIESTEDERLKYGIKRGDILFTRTSETIEEVGISASALDDIVDSCFAGFLIRFRPDESWGVSPEYAAYYFRSDLYRPYLTKEMVLVTRASMSK